jgi:aspartyl-tRNA(Asn)/glutamyl-tRNA(Gln) amidotransferase subunit A
VPTSGVFPLAPSLDTVGPMARTVDDLELLLSVLAPDTLGSPTSRDREPLVVGVWEGSTRLRALLTSLAWCTRRHWRWLGTGARVLSVASAELPAPYSALGITVAVEGIAGHRRAGLWPERRDDYLPAVRHRLEQASDISPERYAAAQRDRALATSWLGACWVWWTCCCPRSRVSPAPIGHDAAFDGPQAREFRQRVMAFTALQSLTGLPACTVRAGFDDQGLPVGVQLTAAWGRERVLLDAARLLTAETAPAVRERWPDDVSSPRSPDTVK